LQPSCLAPADPYVEHDALLVALDLILLKRGVYRHLLFNRGTPPRKVERTVTRSGRSGDDDDPNLSEREWEQNGEEKHATAQDDARERTRRRLIVRLGAFIVLVDSFVRWSRLRKSAFLSSNCIIRRAGV